MIPVAPSFVAYRWGSSRSQTRWNPNARRRFSASEAWTFAAAALAGTGRFLLLLLYLAQALEPLRLARLRLLQAARAVATEVERLIQADTAEPERREVLLRGKRRVAAVLALLLRTSPRAARRPRCPPPPPTRPGNPRAARRGSGGGMTCLEVSSWNEGTPINTEPSASGLAGNAAVPRRRRVGGQVRRVPREPRGPVGASEGFRARRPRGSDAGARGYPASAVCRLAAAAAAAAAPSSPSGPKYTVGVPSRPAYTVGGRAADSDAYGGAVARRASPFPRRRFSASESRATRRRQRTRSRAPAPGSSASVRMFQLRMFRRGNLRSSRGEADAHPGGRRREVGGRRAARRRGRRGAARAGPGTSRVRGRRRRSSRKRPPGAAAEASLIDEPPPASPPPLPAAVSSRTAVSDRGSSRLAATLALAACRPMRMPFGTFSFFFFGGDGGVVGSEASRRRGSAAEGADSRRGRSTSRSRASFPAEAPEDTPGGTLPSSRLTRARMDEPRDGARG